MKRAMAWWVPAKGKPLPMAPASVGLERDLEDWIESDVTIAVDDVLVIARQPITVWGTRLDLLGIDAEGNLVVLELKRKQTLRDTVAQAIEYAAWASKLTAEAVLSLADDKFGGREEFEEAFRKKFETDLPEVLNEAQRIVIVAPEIDDVTTTVVDYLATAYKMPINAAWFDVFDQADGERVLVRLTVVEEERARQRPPTDHRPPAKTLDDMRSLALQNNALEPLNELLQLHEVLPSLAIYQTNLNLRKKALDYPSYLAGISIYPSQQGHPDCVTIALNPSNLARVFGATEEAATELVVSLRSALPTVPTTWIGWERFEVRTVDQARTVTQRLRALAHGGAQAAPLRINGGGSQTDAPSPLPTTV